MDQADVKHKAEQRAPVTGGKVQIRQYPEHSKQSTTLLNLDSTEEEILSSVKFVL